MKRSVESEALLLPGVYYFQTVDIGSVELILSIPVSSLHFRFHCYRIPNTYYLEYLLFGILTIWNTYYLEYLLFGILTIWNTLILYWFHNVTMVSLITYILQISHHT